jgi:hypothetical protein
VPVIFTRTAATPFRLEYRAEIIDAVLLMGIRTQAQLINDAAAGPLRQLLRDTLTDAEWIQLPLGPLLSIYIYAETTNLVSLCMCAVMFDAIFLGRVLRVDANAPLPPPVSDDMIRIELKYHHSMWR